MTGPQSAAPAPPLAPPPGSAEERARFAELQAAFRGQFERVFPDRLAPRTVVVVPSLTMAPAELAKIPGVAHYEERMLFTLMLLRLPRTRLVYVTSRPVAPAVVDYHLHLLPGVPAAHARERLTMLACHDGSDVALTQKVLDRPRLMQRIRQSVADPDAAHLTCFTTTDLERTLSVRLGLPLYGCDPDLVHLGTKSGSRQIFRATDVDLPDGAEDLADLDEVAEALAALKGRSPALRKAVVKLNEGFSGEGNAVFSFEGAPAGGLEAWVRRELPGRLRFEAAGETVERYAAAVRDMHGIVEAWVDGPMKASPSVQCRVDPAGRAAVVSTHDQVLGGPNGQVYLGCTFPADGAYRQLLTEAGQRVADHLAERGVLGRFAVDFVVVRDGADWRAYAIEVNLRKGGTTHPYDMLDFLVDGSYDADSGLYRAPSGQPLFYLASDNLASERYRGLTPRDLIDVAVERGLHFHSGAHEGVVFHLIGALSEFGKAGVLCVGGSPRRARELYDGVVAALDAEAGEPGPAGGARRQPAGDGV